MMSILESKSSKNVFNTILVCPECQRNIPDLSLRFPNSHLCIYLKCSCLQNERIWKVEDLQQLPIKNENNVCSNHSNNKADLFCLECLSWLCQECLKYHSEFAKNHNLINNAIYFECKIHEQNFSSYCSTCSVNICSVCKSNHQTHNLIDIQEETFPEINERLNHKKVNNQQLLDLFNQRIDGNYKNRF